MRSPPFAVASLVAALSGGTSTGCAALGWTFAPGSASTDTAVFAEPPAILRRGDTYALAWTYGSSGFFFQPRYQVREGRLVFSLQGSSSSGTLRGKPAEIVITEPEARHALIEGGACWWEPEGGCTPLRIVAR